MEVVKCVKKELKIEYYGRYVDDFYLFDKNINNLFIYNGEPKHTDRKNISDNNYEYEFLTFLFIFKETY